MKIKIVAALTAAILSQGAFAANTYYKGYIKTLQSEGIDDPYNTVHLDTNVTTSNCGGTNTNNRLAITNSAQHSAALAAVIAGKEVEISGNGNCNVAGIEVVGFIKIHSK